MKKNLFLSFLFLSFLTVNAQSTNTTDSLAVKKDTLFQPNYPEGLYETKEDFINKKPRWYNKVTPKGIYGFNKKTLTDIEHNCFFYFTKSDTKVERIFAISYKGHLYFQIGAILNNRNKSDKNQTTDFPNSFVRVIMGGDNYFYTEANLANAWAQGFAYGGIGGGVGTAVAGNMIYGKGIVWDFKNSEFNIFKNCEDYNEFIKDKDPNGVQTCKKSQPDVWEIRKIIEKIK